MALMIFVADLICRTYFYV